MDKEDKAAIIAGLKALGQAGLEGAEVIKAALIGGELEIIYFDEAQAWIEEIDGAKVIAEAFAQKAAG